MNLLAIDPSFSRTGVAICKVENKKLKEVSLYAVKPDAKSGKDVQSVFWAAQKMVDDIIRIANEPSYVISEEPFPGGSYSAGLFGLDFLLFNKIISLPSVVEFYNLSPTYLGYVHRTRRYNKSDSVDFAKRFLQMFSNNGVKVEMPKRLPHDSAEAFIFMLRLLLILEVQFDSGLVYNMVCDTRLVDQKEKLLFRR